MLNQQIYEEAGEWFTRMRDGESDPAVRNELMNWLRRSPEHVGAYLDIAAVWVESKHVAVDADVDLQKRVARARADLNITEFLPKRVRDSKNGRRWKVMQPVAVAAAATLVVVGAWFFSQRNTYATSPGEQRSLALPDGSTVELNSRSRLRVHFSADERTVELLEGQALFRVRKESARPFIVRSNGASVRAVGTEFDVYRKRGGTIVTVIEGRVAVVPPDVAAAGKESVEPVRRESGSPPRVAGSGAVVARGIYLTAGEQLTVTPRSTPRPVRVNIAAATAWTQRLLVFEFTPLAEAAEEFNRYNDRRLVVEGAALRDFKISAMFRSTDPGSLVRYMQSQPAVRIEEAGDTIRIRSAED